MVITNLHDPMGREVAVFLDWENIKISLEEVGRSPDPGLLRRAVEQFGRMSVAKAYSDWSTESYRRDMEGLYTAGIEPVYAPSKMPTGDEGQMRWHHNSVDIKLAVDCTLTACSRPDIDTFVLVTGDADFIHLVNALRWQGRRVVVIGTSWNAARRLVENADVFIAYDGGVDRGLTSALMAVHRSHHRPPPRSMTPAPQPVPSVPVSVPVPIAPSAPPPAPAPAPAPRQATADPEEAFAALGSLIRNWPEGVRLSRLKGMLRDRLGRFDERRIGFSRFERFAREAERRGVVRIEPGPDEPLAYPPGARIPTEPLTRSSDAVASVPIGSNGSGPSREAAFEPDAARTPRNEKPEASREDQRPLEERSSEPAADPVTASIGQLAPLSTPEPEAPLTFAAEEVAAEADPPAAGIAIEVIAVEEAPVASEAEEAAVPRRRAGTRAAPRRTSRRRGTRSTDEATEEGAPAEAAPIASETTES